MNKRKWLVNFILLMSMVVTCFMMSGFYAEACTMSNVTIDGQTHTSSGYNGISIDDEESTTFKAADIESSGNPNVVIYVLNGSTVEIPVTLYIAHEDAVPAENYSVIVGETSYPTTRTEHNGASVLMASFTVPFAAQDNSIQTVAFSGSYVNEDSTQEAFTDKFTLVSVAELPCGNCSSTYNEGTLVHESCSVCQAVCDGSNLLHKACAVCSAVCDGTSISHMTYTECNAVCDGTSYTHEESCVNAPVIIETTPVYFSNTENWTAVYAYFWQNGDSDLGAQPGLSTNPFENPDNVTDIVVGEPMTHVEGSIWSLDIPVDTQKIIFSNNGAAQTAELTIPTDGKNLYTYSTGKWTVYGEAPDDAPIKILEQPVSVTVALNEGYRVSVKAEGEGLKYQWYLKNEGDDNWYESAVKSRIYNGTMTNARANRQVYCVITDAYGNTVTSEIATLNLKHTELKIITQPVDDEAAKGESFKVTVKAQGDGLKYQWYLMNVGSTQWFESAVKSASYKGVMSDATAGRQLKCVITDKYGNTVESEAATLQRTPTDLKIVTQPVDDEAGLKETYHVSVEAVGDGLKYQWYLKNAGSDTFYLSAVQTRKYSGTMTKARANRQVYCVITDAYGNTVQSETVTLVCPDV